VEKGKEKGRRKKEKLQQDNPGYYKVEGEKENTSVRTQEKENILKRPGP
jgi:hypothetical protein